jgi:putative transposase
MYSLDQREKAVELYIKNGLREAKTIRELGYPTFNTLPVWYEEFRITGALHKDKKRYSKYSTEQKLTAIKYYFEHEQCASRTVDALGYPSRPILMQWITSENDCSIKYSLVKCSQRNRQRTRRCRTNMAKKTNKNNGDISSKDNNQLISEKEMLVKQVEILQKQIYRLQLEKDVLEKAAEIIKKDRGISLESLNNREKAIVINALRNRYQLKELLSVFHMAKSSYCYQVISIDRPDKFTELRKNIKTTFEESSSRYGYRRVHAILKTSGTVVSEKIIRRIMKEEHLIVLNVKRKKYSSYTGEISMSVENIINRDFHAQKPNVKWLTDITEFHIPAGKVYLSPIIYCFDGLPVSWTIGTSPDAKLVNVMLDEAISMLNQNEHPIIHSDRGCHYRWPGWIERMEQANLKRSMSKKGCSPDNSACEGFFGRLKNEMFYGRSWTNISIEQFIEQLNIYITWYSEKRIKMSLGGMSPLDYRRSLGLVA